MSRLALRPLHTIGRRRDLLDRILVCLVRCFHNFRRIRILLTNFLKAEKVLDPFRLEISLHYTQFCANNGRHMVACIEVEGGCISRHMISYEPLPVDKYYARATVPIRLISAAFLASGVVICCESK